MKFSAQSLDSQTHLNSVFNIQFFFSVHFVSKNSILESVNISHFFISTFLSFKQEKVKTKKHSNGWLRTRRVSIEDSF
jgi:hypothetical protein